jgi:hypothetical protein
MTHAIHDIGVAKQIGAYSDAIEAGPNLRWLLTSGTPGLSTGGELRRISRGRRNSPGNTSCASSERPA